MFLLGMQNDGMDVPAILDRVKRLALGPNGGSDLRLAGAINVNRATIASWRHRGSIPFDYIQKLSEKFKVSVDWIVNGGEWKSRASPYDQNIIDVDVLEMALFDCMQNPNRGAGNIWENASDIVMQYHMLSEQVILATQHLHQPREKVISAMRQKRGLSAQSPGHGVDAILYSEARLKSNARDEDSGDPK